MIIRIVRTIVSGYSQDDFDRAKIVQKLLMWYFLYNLIRTKVPLKSSLWRFQDTFGRAEVVRNFSRCWCDIFTSVELKSWRLSLYYFQDTFGRAKTWVKELQRQASPNIVIALAGNKADLANKRMVEYEVRFIDSFYISGFQLGRHSGDMSDFGGGQKAFLRSNIVALQEI